MQARVRQLFPLVVWRALFPQVKVLWESDMYGFQWFTSATAEAEQRCEDAEARLVAAEARLVSEQQELGTMRQEAASLAQRAAGKGDMIPAFAIVRGRCPLINSSMPVCRPGRTVPEGA